MVHIEKVMDPFNAFYLTSFSYILEEEEFKDALRYEKDEKSQIIRNKPLEAFQHYAFSFGTYLIKNENNEWLGYIQLYNDLFVKQQFLKYKKIAIPKLKKIAEFSKDEEYYQNFSKKDCTSYDMQHSFQLIIEHYSQSESTKKEIDAFYLKCQKLLEERPEYLFIEFALYERIPIFPEDILFLMKELEILLEKEEQYANCDILLKCVNQDIFFNKQNFKKMSKEQNTYYFIKERPILGDLTRKLDKKSKL